MLKICTDTLPQTCLSYLAFRLAFCETLERIALWKRFDRDTDDAFGYLAEVPFLKEVPPHVQLDLLAQTWASHLQPHQVAATLIDESIVYATCETAARLVDQDPASVRQFLKSGPLQVDCAVDHQLSSELRSLHLNLSNEGDFLLIGQFLDMDPDEAETMKRQFRIQPQSFDVMFDVLGRYRVRSSFIDDLRGLLTDDERARVVRVLELK